jgi:HK97 family phage portal protein
MEKSILSRLVEWVSPRRREAELVPDAVGAKLLEAHLEKHINIADSIGASDGKPVFSDWSTKRAIDDGLKASTWVYTCANLVSKSVGSVPLKVMGDDGEEVENTSLGELLAMPNSFWTLQITLVRMMLHLMLGGNALFVKNRGGLPAPAPVLELWLVHPDQIKPVVSKEKIVSHYEFKDAQGKKRNIPTEDVVHLQFVDPGNMYWGLSIVQAAAKTIDTEVEAVTWNKVAMQNRAVSDGLFSFDRKLSRDQWIEARLRIREQHMGSKNARMPWVLGDGGRFVSMQMTPVEMDFIQSRKMTREEICAVFGVPPVLVGDLERATYSNYETARLVFWEDTIVPLLVMVEQALTLGLVGDFPDVPPNSTIQFDLSKNKILNQLTPDKITVASGLQTMGVPFEIINDRLNLGIQEFPGWGVSYLGTGLVPASQVALDPFLMMDEEQLTQLAVSIDTQRNGRLLT